MSAYFINKKQFSKVQQKSIDTPKSSTKAYLAAAIELCCCEYAFLLESIMVSSHTR